MKAESELLSSFFKQTTPYWDDLAPDSISGNYGNPVRSHLKIDRLLQALNDPARGKTQFSMRFVLCAIRNSGDNSLSGIGQDRVEPGW